MFFEENRREAYEVERAQAKQSSVGATLAYMFGKYVLAPLVKLAITYFITILWVAFLLFMAGKSMWLGLLDDSNNALSIKKAGGAIILAETGHASRVRFFYMEPEAQERLINAEVAKRKTP